MLLVGTREKRACDRDRIVPKVFCFELRGFRFSELQLCPRAIFATVEGGGPCRGPGRRRAPDRGIICRRLLQNPPSVVAELAVDCGKIVLRQPQSAPSLALPQSRAGSATVTGESCDKARATVEGPSSAGRGAGGEAGGRASFCEREARDENAVAIRKVVSWVPHLPRCTRAVRMWYPARSVRTLAPQARSEPHGTPS